MDVPPPDPLTTDELTQALRAACYRDRPDEVRSLLQRGADVNGHGVDVFSGRTPLHVACRTARVEVVKELLENGAQVDAKTHGEEDETPCVTACMYGGV